MKKLLAIYIFLLLPLSMSPNLSAQDSTLPEQAPMVSEKNGTADDALQTEAVAPIRIDDKDVIKAFSDSLQQESGFPVTVNNNVVFRLYGKLGSIEAEQRALKTSKLLTNFFRSPTPVDSLTIIEGETLTAISTSSNIIAAFSEEDAEAENMSRQELADSALAKISKQAEKFREETSGRNILLSVLKSLALLVALAVFWHYLNNFFTLMDGWIQKIRLHHSSNSGNKLIQLLSPDHLASGLGWFSKVVELFLKILLIYAYLATMLSFFPWTEDLSTNLLAFVLEPAKKLSSEFVTLIPNAIAIIILITITRYLGKFSDILFRNISKGELKLGDFDAEWAEPTRKIVKITIYLLLVLVLFASLPLANNQTALALAIIVGLTVSLSAVPTVQNMFTGIMLNYTGSFRIGDRIKLGDITGDIVYKGPLVIRIKTLLNEVMLIPNTTAFRSKIINYTESVQKNGHLSLELPFYLKKSVKTETLRELVIDAALGTDGIMLDPKPSFLRLETKNGLFGYILRVNTREVKNLETIYSRLFQNVQNKLQENNYE